MERLHETIFVGWSNPSERNYSTMEHHVEMQFDGKRVDVAFTSTIDTFEPLDWRAELTVLGDWSDRDRQRLQLSSVLQAFAVDAWKEMGGE